MGKPSLEIECLRSSDWNSAEARHCLKERGWKAEIERLKTRYFRVVELECFEQFQQGNAIGGCNSQHPGGEQFRWKRPGRDRQLCRCESCAHREETRRLRRSAIEINDSVTRSSLSSVRLICSWPHLIASAAAVSMSRQMRTNTPSVKFRIR